MRIPVKPQPIFEDGIWYKPKLRSYPGLSAWKEVTTYKDGVAVETTKVNIDPPEIFDILWKPPIQPGQIWFGREYFKNTIDDKSFVVVQYSDESIRTQLNDHGGEGDPIGTREHKNPMSLVGKRNGCKWRAANHMPQWASRIVRKCVSVRVERLQDVSESDAMRSVETEILYINGSLMYRNPFTGNFDNAFELMWEVIHGRDSWQQNPWVWVIESLDHK